MTEIPSQVLSEHFQERLAGRQLVAAVFTSYQFDPGFFEQEILPVFLDMSLSHAVPIRLLRLEDGLTRVPSGVAVYYDRNGLELSDSGSARLDVRRIPIRHPVLFHSKLVFALVRDREADESNERPRALIVAALSANLTRAGWWRNVEVCHSEELQSGARSRLRDALLEYLRSIRERAGAAASHDALDAVADFLRSETEGSRSRVQSDRLLPHFHGGTGRFVDFLARTAKGDLNGMSLEVISPSFDESGAQPLRELIEAFHPSAVRVLLPRKPDGSASCTKGFFEAASALDGVSWGHLPVDLMRLGKAKDSGDRYVHAKVYRFFTPRPKRELLFVGSVNLTTPAHQQGGNDEAGFLVEVDPPRRPDFWLEADDRVPRAFATKDSDDKPAASGGTDLQIRFDWSTRVGEAFWGATTASPPLELRAQGAMLATLGPVAPGRWVALDVEVSRRLEGILQSTSLLEVCAADANPGILLVQEEGMLSKPSLLFLLSVSDILRYWAQMNDAQRTVFLEERAPDVLLSKEGAELIVRFARNATTDSVFDRMAGIFHAFSCREQALRRALEGESEPEARHMLLGRRIDSLGVLLHKLGDETHRDAVDRYVIYMCARQLCAELRKTPWGRELWKTGGPDIEYLEDGLAHAASVRAELLAVEPGSSGFLDWFDKWFLRRAEPIKVHEAEAAP